MEYQILSGVLGVYDPENKSNFEKAVEEAMADGWECTGGLTRRDGTFFQAMVKK